MTSIHQQSSRGNPPRGREVGAQIAGVFGMVFVVVNSEALPPLARVPLLVLAGSALVLVVGLSVRSYRADASRDTSGSAGSRTAHGSSPFGWQYWLIVGIEAVALFGGTRLLIELGYPKLGVAWVALVVGTHFFALGRLFRLSRFHLLGVVVTALGIAGFVLFALKLVAAIPVVSGVLSGLALLAFGLWAIGASPHER